MLNMRVSGKTIKRMEKVNFIMQMETCMTENGKMTKPMDMDNIFTQMVLAIKVNGNKTYKMGLVPKLGQTGVNSKVTTVKVENREKESIFGKMVATMKETGKTIK